MLGPSAEQHALAFILDATDRAYDKLRQEGVWLYPRQGHVLRLPTRAHLDTDQPVMYLLHCEVTNGQMQRVPIQVHVCGWRLRQPVSFMVGMLRTAIQAQVAAWPVQSAFAIWYEHSGCQIPTHCLKRGVFLGDSVSRGDRILGSHYTGWPYTVIQHDVIMPSYSAMAEALPAPPNQGQGLTAEYLQRRAASVDALQILKQGERFA